MASLPVEQAEATPVFGPQAPARMLTCTDAESTTIIGIERGCMRRGPCSSRSACCATYVAIPPAPLPM